MRKECLLPMLRLLLSHQTHHISHKCVADDIMEDIYLKQSTLTAPLGPQVAPLFA